MKGSRVIVAVVAVLALSALVWVAARNSPPAASPAAAAPATALAAPAIPSTPQASTTAPAGSGDGQPIVPEGRPAVVTSSSAALPPEEPQRPELLAIPRITPANLQRQMAGGSVLVIDVRDADAYMAGHIPGAIHIPLSRVFGETPYLPRDKTIVTYCT